MRAFRTNVLYFEGQLHSTDADHAHVGPSVGDVVVVVVAMCTLCVCCSCGVRILRGPTYTT